MYTFSVPKSHFNPLILHYQYQTNSNLTPLVGSVTWLTTIKVTRYKDAFLFFVGTILSKMFSILFKIKILKNSN